jgi:hypothetical protein
MYLVFKCMIYKHLPYLRAESRICFHMVMNRRLKTFRMPVTGPPKAWPVSGIPIRRRTLCTIAGCMERTVAGATRGLAASFVMNQFQGAWSKAAH